MAKLILNNDTERANFLPYSATSYAIIGVVTGLVFWLMLSVFGYFTDSLVLSGNIALILSMLFAVLVMLLRRMASPLLVSVSVVLSLWGIAGWADGLSTGESIFWYLILHTIGYLLFSWIATIKRRGLAILIAIFIVILIQVIFSLQ